MTGVKAVELLSLDDYDGAMGDQIIYSSEFPGVAISISPSHSIHELKRLYILFGIMIAIHRMTQYGSFQALSIDIMYGSSQLGWIKFSKASSPFIPVMGSESDSTQDLTTKNASSLLSNGTSSLTMTISDVDPGDPSNSKLKVFVKFRGKPISLEAALMSTINAMCAGGKDDRNERIDKPKVVKVLRWGVQVIVDNFSRRPRTNPPFFDYGSVIKAIARAPRYMFNERRFNELEMVIELDGVPFGQAWYKLLPSLSRPFASTSEHKQTKVDTS